MPPLNLFPRAVRSHLEGPRAPPGTSNYIPPRADRYAPLGLPGSAHRFAMAPRLDAQPAKNSMRRPPGREASISNPRPSRNQGSRYLGSFFMGGERAYDLQPHSRSTRTMDVGRTPTEFFTMVETRRESRNRCQRHSLNEV